MPLTCSLDEATVVITGASSGIGASTAYALARRGADVVLAARSEEALHRSPTAAGGWAAGRWWYPPT